MPRLIDADALKNSMPIEVWDVITAAIYPKVYMGKEVHKYIDNAPTIDAEPVRHGRWGFLGMDMMAGSRAFYFGTCTECRERINFELKHKNYCPNCGAKMDKEDSK